MNDLVVSAHFLEERAVNVNANDFGFKHDETIRHLTLLLLQTTC